MKYNGVILKKFAVMNTEIAKLRELGHLTADRLDHDHFLKHGIERALQICVEVVVDVAQRILALEGKAPAPTAFDALGMLESMRILSDAGRYRTMIQFRNFVVHRYEQIDAAVLIDVLEHRLDDLSAFQQEVTVAE